MREKNNGRVCRHSRARRIVRFFHETKTSLLPAEHLKKVFVWREELNEKKMRKKSQSHGDDAQRDGLDEQSVFLVRPAFSGFRDRVFFSRFHFHAGRRFFSSFFVFFFLFFRHLSRHVFSKSTQFSPLWGEVEYLEICLEWLLYRCDPRALSSHASVCA